MGAALVAAPRTPVDHTLAKEGTSAVGSARPFPLDDTAAKPLADQAAPRATPTQSAVHEPAPTWPILARIAEITEHDHPTATSDSKSYRVDSPHAAAPPARPLQRLGTSEALADATQRQEHVLALAPLPIRLTAQAWRLMQPYLGIIRFTAMLALMAIGGTSMTLMMGGFRHHTDMPTSSGATAVDQTSTLQAEPSPIEPGLRLDTITPPDAKSSSTAPTAIGPTAAKSKLVMAIEPSEPASETSTPWAAASTKTADVSAGPTQRYPVATQPNVDSEPWPQTQTAAAIATLQGVVLETETR